MFSKKSSQFGIVIWNVSTERTKVEGINTLYYKVTIKIRREKTIMLSKKIKKRIVALLIVSAFTMPVMAAKNNFSFSVLTSTNDGEAYSAPNMKSDAEQRAYVTTTSSNITPTTKFFYSVRSWRDDAEKYRYTAHRRQYSTTGKLVIDYIKSASKGQSMYLQGDTDKHYVKVNGVWNS